MVERSPDVATEAPVGESHDVGRGTAPPAAKQRGGMTIGASRSEVSSAGSHTLLHLTATLQLFFLSPSLGTFLFSFLLSLFLFHSFGMTGTNTGTKGREGKGYSYK